MGSQQLPSVARPGHVQAGELLQYVLSHKPLVGEFSGRQLTRPDQAFDRLRVDVESFGYEIHICVLVERVRLQHTAHRRSPPLTSLRETPGICLVCLSPERFLSSSAYYYNNYSRDCDGVKDGNSIGKPPTNVV